ncbi:MULTISPECIES: phosphatase PAP2 family protein [Actinomadura]|uniref:Phosphatase PAP2 family protein n=1 Tax=Actinomadura yumaensis TaxID=111807 RepID=A0ABW2CXJ7_9ACTN|nr:phosphatase PAP2 family protein [Actinomadura sp. J1-007]MWK37722.1 phosphatase PAP2 family protein [Actinomadura sp. J1-007]
MATRVSDVLVQSGARRPGCRDLAVTAGLAAVLGGLFLLYGPLNQGPAAWNVRTPLDEHVPLVTPMVVPYVSALALGPLTLLYFAATRVRLAQSALLAGIALLAVAYLFYFFAQTRMDRPEVTGGDPFSALLRTVYGSDDAYNCFPSLHTGFSVVIGVHWLWSGHRAGPYVAGWCCLIIASTLLVHQHYLADMLAGLAVAGAACLLARRTVAARHTGEPPEAGDGT